MPRRATETAVVAVLAAAVTLVIAAPVLLAPSERIFGMEIVGRHYDPFTVMAQFERPIGWTAFLQPVTDLPGVWLATFLGPVASYNAVVLLSFPFAAATVYLLARHCSLSPLAGAGAALAVAFSPFHVAHAAYHPHVAQLQWMPLYLLALWRCLDRPTWRAAVVLALAGAAVTLSNFYGGFIAAILTPVAMAAYWLFKMRRNVNPLQRVAMTSAVLIAAAIAGAGYAGYVGGDVLRGESTIDFARRDLSKYGAEWSSYLVPPMAHPWRDATSSETSHQSGLLEQQVSLGWGLIALSAIAVGAWVRHRRTDVPLSNAPLSNVPIFVVVASFALLCSLPFTTILYEVLPMFRSYARFGSVVQLMVALLAAIGAERLWQSRERSARIVMMALVTFAAIEYAVWPPAMWRDVLPTAAHRWVARQPPSTRALDCFPHTEESQSIQWLTVGRIILRERAIGDCREPGVIAALSATGFTHMLIRRDTAEGQWLEGRPPPAGLGVAARFEDADVYAVIEPPSLIRTVRTEAFYPVEFDHWWTWRWMGPQASWTVVNSSARSLLASVDLETNAFHEPRRLVIVLDGAEVQEIVIDPQRAVRRIGPMALRPGEHTLTFRAQSPPAVADHVIHNGDPRPLSVAFGEWRWLVDGGGK